MKKIYKSVSRFIIDAVHGEYNLIDKFYDLIVYLLIALCFTGSGILIVRQLVDIESNYLWHIGAFIGFGLVMSLWIFKLKSMAR